MGKTKFSIDLGLDSIKIKSVERNNLGDYHIHVSCSAKNAKCPGCGKSLTKSHGQCKETMVEHLPILDKRVFIHVMWPRFYCSDCDSTTSFHPEWLNETGTMTTLLENYILKCLINSTVKDVAEKLALTEDVVEGIVDRRITLDINWSGYSPTVLGIDEIALRKGHKQYLTIVTDISVPGHTKIVAVLKGRTKKDIKPFLDSIPDSVINGLQGICIDMAGSYFTSLKERIDDPDMFSSLVTIDRFHVAKLIGKKVDKQRKKVMAQLKKKYAEDEQILESLKGTMWPFRHHPEDLNEEQEISLNQLFELSPELKALHVLREELYHIFETDYLKDEASEAIEEWIGNATHYKAFRSFIETYQKYEENILNYFHFRFSSGPAEGLNNKLKVIKRRGFGFRNITCFAKRVFLDINYRSNFIPAMV